MLEEQKKTTKGKVGDVVKASEGGQSIATSTKMHENSNIDDVMEEQAEVRPIDFLLNYLFIHLDLVLLYYCGTCSTLGHMAKCSCPFRDVEMNFRVAE